LFVTPDLLTDEPHREKRGQLFIGQAQFKLILKYLIAIPGAFFSIVSAHDFTDIRAKLKLDLRMVYHVERAAPFVHPFPATRFKEPLNSPKALG
jgi:hypothetical protein